MLSEVEVFKEIATHPIRLAVCYHLSFGPMEFGEILDKVNEYYTNRRGCTEGISANDLNYHLYDKKHLIEEGIVKEENDKYFLGVSELIVDFVRGVYVDGDFRSRVEMLDPSFFERFRI